MSADPRHLEGVTLLCADCRNHAAALRALERCTTACTFDRVLFFTDRAVTAPAPVEVVTIPSFRNRDDYSRFLVKEVVDHVESGHALVVQWDGFILDPACWSDDFRRYDYIGARWFWFGDAMQVGNGGFSLRSRRLLHALRDERVMVEQAEDLSICREHRSLLEREFGIVFAPDEVADRFSYERTIPDGPTFGFHGLFNLWRHLDGAGLATLLDVLPPETLASDDMVELICRLTVRGRTADAKLVLNAAQRVRDLASIAETAKRYLAPSRPR